MLRGSDFHSALPGSNKDVISNEWLASNIQQGHGPLGAVYPDVAYGMEGDTPSFLNLINNGLSSSEDPNFGGWGGRYEFYLPDFKDSNTGPFKRENWPKDEPGDARHLDQRQRFDHVANRQTELHYQPGYDLALA